LLPFSANQTAKCTATVDFPTPPFWFATATIMEDYILGCFLDGKIFWFLEIRFSRNPDILKSFTRIWLHDFWVSWFLGCSQSWFLVFLNSHSNETQMRLT
jgi:hypothetical protein